MAGELSQEVRRRTLELLRAGNVLETAVAAAGGTERVLRQWIEDGEAATDVCENYQDALDAGEQPAEDQKPTAEQVESYEFTQALRRANAEAEARFVTIIAKAAQDGSWQAAQWLLERRNAEDWGRRKPIGADRNGPDDARDFMADLYTLDDE